MSILKNTLDHCRQWLINDQHEYGEFGRHEIINPTDLPRTYELSLIKPNVFSSIVAYTTLLATGNVPSSTNDSFHKWIEGIRSDNGYWTSASGKTMPFSGRAGWSSNINLRHTAKGLDYNLLSGNFGYQDALIFNDIITSQLSDGSFPQFKGMDADLWSTAYYINLLIRATMEENLRSTLPRGYKILDWKNQLKNKLDRAINWLLEQLDKDYLWKICGTDSYVITLAMMVEVGGYLAIYKPEICASIIRNLLVSGQKSPTFVYVACLALDTLLAHEQGEIRKLYNELIQVDNITPLDLLEVVSLCKLRFLNSNLDMLDRKSVV